MYKASYEAYQIIFHNEILHFQEFQATRSRATVLIRVIKGGYNEHIKIRYQLFNNIFGT